MSHASISLDCTSSSWQRVSTGYVSVWAERTDGGAAEVYLLTASGRKVVALSPAFAADGRAHRLNFPAPEEAFRIVGEGSVQLKEARPYSAWERTGDKLAPAWPVLGGLLGALLLAWALRGLWRRRSWFARLQARSWTLPGWLGAVLPWVVLTALLTLASQHLDTYAGGADSAGYLGSAKLLQAGALSRPLPRPAESVWSQGPEAPAAALFQPPGYAPAPKKGAEGAAALVPSYPLGFPLFIAAAEALLPAGWGLPVLMLLQLASGVLLLRALARAVGFDGTWAWWLAGLLALCPVYLFMGVQPMSDVPALVWVSAAALCAWRAGAGAGSRGWALAAGTAAGVAVLVRPTNLLVFPALLWALGARPRVIGYWILGGLPLGLLEAAYNLHSYGAVLRTGYGSVGSLFELRWLGPTLLHYLRWFPAVLSPLVLLAAGLPFLRGVGWRLRGFLLLWAGAFLATYAIYACTHETWWYLRFLLPAFPPLLLALGLVARQVAGTAVSRRWLCFLLALLPLCWELEAGRLLDVLSSGRGNASYEDCCRWLREQAPERSLIVTNYAGGALLYYTRFAVVLPEQEADVERVQRLARETRHPLYAVYFRWDTGPLPLFRGGHWQELHRHGDLCVWRWCED